MLRSLAAVAVLLSALLAGCAVLDGGGSAHGDVVRIVEMAFDPEAFDDVNDATDVFASLAETRFEYTHDAGGMDPRDVQVSYTDEAGREREAPLSDFTSQDTLGRGDRVTIGGALLTSPLEIRHGDDVLASRGGRPADWLLVAGYPLPLALDGGLAEWDVDGRLGVDGAMDRFQVVERGMDQDYSCPPPQDPMGEWPPCTSTMQPYNSTFRLTDAVARASADLDGVVSVRSLRGTSPALEVGLSGTWVLDAFFDVHALMQRDGAYPEDFDANVGFELDLSLDGDGTVTLRFGRDGGLDRMGAQGRLDGDGDLVVWDDEHPRSEGYTPGFFDDLSFSESVDEQEVPLEDNPVAFIAQAMADLWRMDLVPGDEFRFKSPEGDPDLPTVSITTRVVERAEKAVPAGRFDALRIEMASVVTVPVEGRPAERFELPTYTTWIDEDSGVPVAVQQSMAYDFDEEDLAPWLGLAEEVDEDVTVTAPEVLHLSVDGRTVAELTEWDDGLRMAPMAAVLMPLTSMASPLAWAFLTPYGMGFGEEVAPEPAEHVPDIAFVVDAEGPGGILTVVSVESGVSWWDIGTTDAQTSCQSPFGDVQAGDEIRCTEDGRVTVVHFPSNTVIFVTEL